VRLQHLPIPNQEAICKEKKKNQDLGGSGGHQVEHVSNVPSLQRRLIVSCFALGKVLPAGWGRLSFPSSQHWWGHSWSALCCAGRGARTYWRYSYKGPLRWWWFLLHQSFRLWARPDISCTRWICILYMSHVLRSQTLPC